MKNFKRPRMLVLSPRYPYPVIGGDRLRIYYLCKELCKDYSLTLLSLCETQSEMISKVPNDGIFDRTERVLLPKWRSLLNVALALPTQRPLQIAYYHSEKFATKIAELLPDHDVCLAHLIRTGDYLTGIQKPTVLEMTDAISLNYQRVKKLKERTSLKTWIYSLEASRLLDYEKNAINNFDVVSLVSETDRNFLTTGLGNNRITICSNGVDLTKLPYRERSKNSKVIVFIGNITSAQNFDACIHFIEDFLPDLRLRHDVIFRIVGKINDTDAKNFRKYDGVEVTGLVDSVVEAVKDAVIGVCPVRLGAGVQNKILEYMALGIPAITSSIGLEGLSAEKGNEILVADTLDEYFHAIDRILGDREFAINLSRAGRNYVEKNHDWSSMIQPLRDKISATLKLNRG